MTVTVGGMDKDIATAIRDLEERVVASERRFNALVDYLEQRLPGGPAFQELPGTVLREDISGYIAGTIDGKGPTK